MRAMPDSERVPKDTCFFRRPVPKSLAQMVSPRYLRFVQLDWHKILPSLVLFTSLSFLGEVDDLTLSDYSSSRDTYEASLLMLSFKLSAR
jgi:hypothetical protein